MHLRPFIAALATLPAFALVAQAATQFRDIPAGHWAAHPAGVLADARVMPGRTPLDFAGTAPLTRYELAHIISDLYTVSGPPSTFIVFGDVPPGHANTQAIQRVIGYGLMGLRKPAAFEGSAPASRKEVVEAFDQLFAKNFISPPGRQPRIAFYMDVKWESPLGQVLERIVNRFGLIEPKPHTRFQPFESVTRYEVLSMLVRAMPYLNPTLADKLKPPAATPSPAASGAPASPGASAAPASPGTPASPGASPEPASGPGAPILRSWGWGSYELVMSFAEVLPTEPGATGTGDPKEFSGSLLSGINLGGDYWNGPLGFGGRFSTFFLPVDLNSGGQVSSNNILDSIIQLTGAYKVGAGPDWEAAVGGAGLARVTFNMSTPGRTYLTSDKMYVGAGPLLAYGYRASDTFTFTGTLAAYPVIMQNYTLAAGAASLQRWGADAHLRGEYFIAPTMFLSGAGHMFLMGGAGGTQSIVGATLGGGMTF